DMLFQVLGAQPHSPQILEVVQVLKSLVATGAVFPQQLELTLHAFFQENGERFDAWQFEGLAVLLRAVERLNTNRVQYADALSRLSQKHPRLETAFVAAQHALITAGETRGLATNESEVVAAITFIGQHPR